MALCRTYQPNTRLDHFELDGLINRLDREIAERGEAGDVRTPYYTGAELAMTIVRHHENVQNQDEFMKLFDKLLSELVG